jgi:Rps23 Pro-64 3,4-dihydroxylase Tpa1-like proline 4-hydroxylase
MKTSSEVESNKTKQHKKKKRISSAKDEGDINRCGLEDAVNTMLDYTKQRLPQSMETLRIRMRYHRKDFHLNRWLERYHLEEDLAQSSGLIKISNFLPNKVALKLYDIVRTVSEEEWRVTQADDDVSHNNIRHLFSSSKSFPNCGAIFNIFRRLAPSYESTFSIGNYRTGHFIDPHDDRAHVEIDGELFSRYIAAIYYLTPDWQAKDGGALIDMETKSRYVPEFNSLIAFKVPRWHQVETVTSQEKARYSVFGWFLKKGRLYSLNTGSDNKRTEHPSRKETKQDDVRKSKKRRRKQKNEQ